ncbi:hypothetical protein RSOLAG22IIIB_01396 [Rhizoctonia solani]|uniref:Probable RNA polymerase II nuclear localization protein SLC7A6OS n=1 Tax=Rhizoctonia solani TaxID=456999 RepID=A0A0K6G5W9_9AGAM|nr:hypothetical protein RSOLAG22IIIB_01396 [Rhizoctonia solani]
MTEDPSLLDDQKAKDLHKRLAMINQEPRASPKVSSPVAMVMSPPGAPRSAPPPTREYKVLRTARAPSSAVTSHTTPSASAGTATAHAPVPVPIPIPGQPLPSTTSSASTAATDVAEPSESKFVLYEAVLAAPAVVESEEPTPEMQEFQDLLQEYLRVNEISLDAPPPRKPVTSVALSKKPIAEDDDDEAYVWDVFYQRPNLSGDLSIWDGLANVGTLSGLPPTEGDILADEEDSDSVKDEADEDSNEEDFYRNDYPDTESDSDAYQSDGDHEWR